MTTIKSIAARLLSLEKKSGLRPPPVWSSRVEYDPETEIGTISTLRDGKVVYSYSVRGFDLRKV